MKKNILEYKGYYSKVEYSAEDRILFGKIECIKDLVTFEASNADEIEIEFHNAVDDYLQMCEELGQDPDKVYSGTFNVRIAPELHREMALAALKGGETLNSVVETAISMYLDNATELANNIWKVISADMMHKQEEVSNGNSMVSTAWFDEGGIEYVRI